MASREAQAVRPVPFLEHVIYWRTYFVSDQGHLTANVFCKITFALNSAVTIVTAEFSHNDNNIIVTSCTVLNNIDSLWV